MSIIPSTASVLWLLASLANRAAADPCSTRPPGPPVAASREEADTAKTLFSRGLALEQANKRDEACKMFETSLHLDAQIGTRLNVAACRERQGRLVEAHAMFVHAAEDATRTNDRRSSFALQRVAALEAKLVRMRLRVAEPELNGLSVTLDACSLTKQNFGDIRIASPGPILVHATAPERKSFYAELEGVAGTELVVEVPSLGVDRDAEATRKASEAQAAAALERRTAELVAAQRELDKKYDRHPARVWTIVGAGVGGAVVITGIAFGIGARRAQDGFDSAGCGDREQLLDAAAYAACNDQRDRGKRDALLGNAFLIGGGAAIALALVVYRLDPGNVERPRAVTPMVSPSSVGVAVRW